MAKSQWKFAMDKFSSNDNCKTIHVNRNISTMGTLNKMFGVVMNR
jgi:hypothetical protein